MIKLTSLITPQVIGGVVGSKKVNEAEVVSQDEPQNVANGLPHTDPSADTKEYTLTRENLKNIVREVMKEEEEYQKIFHKMMDKFGVKSPAELSDDEKKKFFSAVKNVQTELKERAKMKEAELKGGQHKLDVDKDGDIEADDLADLRAGKKANEAKKKKW